jgi:hypothetical protein
MPDSFLPLAIAVVGILHAMAGFAYFSKARFGLVWAVAWLLLTIGTILLLPVQSTLALGLFGAAVLAWTVWWARMRPSNDRRWVAENARVATATLRGEQLTIGNVRNFTWHGKGRFDSAWETRTYNLDRLDAADLFVSTWGNKHIAHMLLSFTFTDREPLCFSIETRREKTEKWSTTAGFFRAYEIAIIPADENDHVRVRTNVRGEHVRLYRLNVNQSTVRRLLLAYVDDMNALAEKPRFYHTLWTNCTTEIARLVRTLGIKTPLDWRLVLSGHVPAYLYDNHVLGRGLPFASLDARADIVARAKAVPDGASFSRAIRVDLYDPRVAEFASVDAAAPLIGSTSLQRAG